MGAALNWSGQALGDAAKWSGGAVSDAAKWVDRAGGSTWHWVTGWKPPTTPTTPPPAPDATDKLIQDSGTAERLAGLTRSGRANSFLTGPAGSIANANVASYGLPPKTLLGQ